jgi:hypothetical protein
MAATDRGQNHHEYSWPRSLGSAMRQSTNGRAGMLDDVCRCHDDKCGARQMCARWIMRDEGGAMVNHAVTLKPGYCTHERPCGAYIGESIEFDDE